MTARQVLGLTMAASALILLVAGLYLLLATELSLIGGALMAAGAGDALIGVYLLRGH